MTRFSHLIAHASTCTQYPYVYAIPGKCTPCCSTVAVQLFTTSTRVYAFSPPTRPSGNEYKPGKVQTLLQYSCSAVVHCFSSFSELFPLLSSNPLDLVHLSQKRTDCGCRRGNKNRCNPDCPVGSLLVLAVAEVFASRMLRFILCALPSSLSGPDPFLYHPTLLEPHRCHPRPRDLGLSYAYSSFALCAALFTLIV